MFREMLRNKQQLSKEEFALVPEHISGKIVREA